MGKKVVWLVVSCLMALSLVMASCGTGTVEEEEEEEEVVIGEEEEEEEEEEEAGPGGPQYGGTFHFIGGDPSGFDDGITLYFLNGTAYFTNEDLLQGNWMKGPAGSNEISWMQGIVGRMEMLTGGLAESWELVGDDTIIFHIREGVRWQDKAPVSGREYTAEDAAWNLERHFTKTTAYLARSWPEGQRPEGYKVLDRYTLEVTVPEATQGVMAMIGGGSARHFPPDMVETYGDMGDWRNACGTGPFMLVDYVPGSTVTYERNPNYWMKDPVNPENKLPYIDGVKQLIIPDTSTQLAALRTGKLDALYEVLWEDTESLLKTNPKMETQSRTAPAMTIMGRQDKDLPFSDYRVGQAMNLAVNQQELVDDYYEGNADLFAYPYPDTQEHSPFFTPLDEMPEVVQELFTHNPEKAKQLLADAGYPDGFKTKVLCAARDADFLSIIKEYFAEVGIDLEIQALEFSIYNTQSRGRKHEEMLFTESKNYSFPFRMLDVVPGLVDNVAFFEDDRCVETYAAVNAVVGKDDAEVSRLLRGLAAYRLEQSYGVWLPATYKYNIWWPWVKGYHGEFNIGYFNRAIFTKYLWIDEDLKASMGY